MDHSKEYIEMCMAASDIQKVVTASISNKIVLERGDYYWRNDELFLHLESIHIPKDCIWLPRQDQLQDYWWNHPDTYNKQIAKTSAICQFFFRNWVDHLDYYHYIFVKSKFASMEQLWLAFVMDRLFGKKWDDKTKEWLAIS